MEFKKNSQTFNGTKQPTSLKPTKQPIICQSTCYDRVKRKQQRQTKIKLDQNKFLDVYLLFVIQ